MKKVWRVLAVASATVASIGTVCVGTVTPATASAQSKPVVPMAIIQCGGLPQPDPIECKTWKCYAEVWTLVNKTNGSSCTDGNACTNGDKCSSGKCAGVAAQPGQACSDLNACTVGDACNAAKACIPGSPAPTDDGNPCTSDSCDPIEGVSHVALTSQCCTAGVIQLGRACAGGLCACNVQAGCSAPSSVTRYCYDKVSNMTARQAFAAGQACVACP